MNQTEIFEYLIHKIPTDIDKIIMSEADKEIQIVLQIMISCATLLILHNRHPFPFH